MKGGLEAGRENNEADVEEGKINVRALDEDEDEEDNEVRRRRKKMRRMSRG